MSRTAPSTIAPASPWRLPTVAETPPMLEMLATPWTTSTSPGSARLCASISASPLTLRRSLAARLSTVSGLAEIEAHNLAEPGDVLVVQGVANISSMGGVSAAIGKRQGEIAAIVDGAVRDIDHSRSIGYPIWSAGVSPITGKWRLETIAVNDPVHIASIE